MPRGVPNDPRPRHRHRLRAALTAALSVVALGACGDDAPGRFTDADCEKAVNAADAADAIDWLKDPYGEKRLGSLSRDDGLALASVLEARGARRVVAVGIKGRGGPEGLVRAGGLVVALPDDPKQRRSLFTLHAQQVRSRGFAARADEGQKYLYFPWEP